MRLLLLQIQCLTQHAENKWHKLPACGIKFTGWKPMPRWKTACGIVVVAMICTLAMAQDDAKQGLARPDWQMRADVEFRMACQSALQKLCLEMVQAVQKDPSDPANSKLLVNVEILLETIDGKLPSSLPEHSASIDYVKARKAAVIEWNRVYKVKGRELHAATLNAERKFQDIHRELGEPQSNTTNGKSGIADANTESPATVSESSNDLSGKPTGKDPKNAEKKIEDATIKGLSKLIKQIDVYRSTKLRGDTTLERDLARRAANDAIATFVENQPDFYLTYPIADVSGTKLELVFAVKEPVEFQQIRKELGAELLLSNRINSIHVKNAEILRLGSSIKPGDMLRVRFKVRFAGFKRNIYGGTIDFEVSHTAALGDPSLGIGNSLLTEKAIVGFQLIKRPPQTESSP